MKTTTWLPAVILTAALIGCTHHKRGDAHKAVEKPEECCGMCQTDSKADAKATTKPAGEVDEVVIPFADVPAPARATLTKEAGGVAIDEVEKYTDDGKVEYEVHLTIDGKEYAIKVAPDGTLVKKQLESK